MAFVPPQPRMDGQGLDEVSPGSVLLAVLEVGEGALDVQVRHVVSVQFTTGADQVLDGAAVQRDLTGEIQFLLQVLVCPLQPRQVRGTPTPHAGPDGPIARHEHQGRVAICELFAADDLDDPVVAVAYPRFGHGLRVERIVGQATVDQQHVASLRGRGDRTERPDQPQRAERHGHLPPSRLTCDAGRRRAMHWTPRSVLMLVAGLLAGATWCAHGDDHSEGEKPPYGCACHPIDPDQSMTDTDGDGYTADIDCDDQDSQVHPDAPEVCNLLDDDCDGLVDEETDRATTWMAVGREGDEPWGYGPEDVGDGWMRTFVPDPTDPQEVQLLIALDVETDEEAGLSLLHVEAPLAVDPTPGVQLDEIRPAQIELFGPTSSSDPLLHSVMVAVGSGR